MKKLLIYIVLFFGAVGVIDLSVGFVGDYLQSHAKGGMTRAFDDLVMKDNHDVLVLGSSRALHHYDTPFLSDTLGVDVYNAGHKGNGVILAEGILEMILKHSSPRLIVYDVEPAYDIYEYADDGDKRYLGLLKPYYNVPEVGCIFKDVSYDEWLKVHSGLFRYNTSIVSMAVDYMTKREQPVYGYVPLTGVMSRDETAVIDSSRTVDLLKLKYIERLIRLAQSHNVLIVFVASPKFGCTDSSELSPVKDVCLRYQVPFLDYYARTEFNEHREWFRDAVHMNAEGALRFSALVAEEISLFL